MIAACIAEMASAIPSSSGVYHWASVTGGAKYGKAIGFFAGWYVSQNTIIAIGSITNMHQVELSRLALWHRIHHLHPRQPSHLHVWSNARGLRI